MRIILKKLSIGQVELIMQTSTIYQQLLNLKANNPNIKNLEAAKVLGISEGELIASRVGVDVVKLLPEWGLVLPAIESFGKIMALTRNNHCINERKGAYVDTAIGEDNKVGLIISSDIDLRFLLSNWGSAFAVTDKVSDQLVKGGLLRSIQFFNKQGNAVHKVFLIDGSNIEAWLPFIERFKDPEQNTKLSLEPAPLAEINIRDEEVDVEIFNKHWSELKDTHHFVALLKDHKISRTQGLRLVGKKWAVPLAIEVLPKLFEKASESKLPIMIFVGNDGCVQIHTGVVENLKWSEGWFNILDPMFNLHLKIDGISELWLVRKPTTEGVVTSIEAYDVNGEIVIQVFGPRRPGLPERKAWRELAESFAVNKE